MKISIFSIIVIAFCFSHITVAQEEKAEIKKDFNNKVNIGWAYYGRGNGVSLTLDHEFSELLSAGIGLEEYFLDDDIETSFFILLDLHLEKFLNIKKLEIYPGVELGYFEDELSYHFYLGLAKDLTNKFGLYTEIGSRGVFGLYMSF